MSMVFVRVFLFSFYIDILAVFSRTSNIPREKKGTDEGSSRHDRICFPFDGRSKTPFSVAFSFSFDERFIRLVRREN